MVKNLVGGGSVGSALSRVKAQMDITGPSWLSNLLVFNQYGCPEVEWRVE